MLARHGNEGNSHREHGAVRAEAIGSLAARDEIVRRGLSYQLADERAVELNREPHRALPPTWR
jgi:hypothetical protein